jgi:hypothetical protein
LFELFCNYLNGFDIKTKWIFDRNNLLGNIFANFEDKNAYHGEKENLFMNVSGRNHQVVKIIVSYCTWDGRRMPRRDFTYRFGNV